MFCLYLGLNGYSVAYSRKPVWYTCPPKPFLVYKDQEEINTIICAWNYYDYWMGIWPQHRWLIMMVVLP